MIEYINVTGWSRHHKQMDRHPAISPPDKGPRDYETGYIVYWWGGDIKINLRVDLSEPITLKRCAEIHKIAEEKTGNTYSRISIDHSVFADDGSTISQKKYEYNPTRNSLLIWEGKNYLMPVYENIDGHICRDRDALADCLL